MSASMETPSASLSAQRQVSPLAGLLVVLVVWALAYWGTIAEMVAIWSRSETFAHGFVVLPISAYLVWQRRHEVSGLPLRPSLPVLVLTIAAMSAWLVGRWVSVAALEHLAVVAVLVTAAWAMLGLRAFRPVAFPMMFLFFMAPVGEFLVPMLMHYTAEFTVAALRASGIPVFQEGLHFVVPNGRWSVVEACSGIRYLIASFMVGTLFAYLNYRGLGKRVAFSVFALLMPIVANWLRAYMIVMIGYLSGNTLAVGVDHLIYGWVFFGVVIMGMFWVGAWWRDDDRPAIAVPQLGGAMTARPITAKAAMVLACVVIGPLVAVQAAVVDRQPAMSLTLPEAAEGWSRVEVAEQDFRPAFQGYRADAVARYVRGDTAVLVYIAGFADQVAGREMVSWDNQLVRSSGPWRVLSRASDPLPVGSVERVQLLGSAGALSVWRWYRIDGRIVTSDLSAKAQLAWSRIADDHDAAAHIVLAVSGEDATLTREAVVAFLVDHAAALDVAVDVALDSVQ
ncbi:MAG: exosortase A [Rhodocyclaceae bacterium]|nr:exosortase A [Rhodocyclaceae bacterium]